MSQSCRHVPPSDRPFLSGSAGPARPVTHIEGAAESGHLAVKPLVVGGAMLLMELHRKKGLIDPLHSHADHESMCYLVSGRMRVEIDGESFIAEPGDSWTHAPGVPHRHETLEDSVQIEVKSPPRKTWT